MICVATEYFSAIGPELFPNTLLHHWCCLAYSVRSTTSYASSSLSGSSWPSATHHEEQATSLATQLSYLLNLLIQKVAGSAPGRAKWRCVLEQGSSPYLPPGKCHCTYCKSLWIRASAKWLNLNVCVKDCKLPKPVPFPEVHVLLLTCRFILLLQDRLCNHTHCN